MLERLFNISVRNIPLFGHLICSFCYMLRDFEVHHVFCWSGSKHFEE